MSLRKWEKIQEMLWPMIDKTAVIPMVINKLRKLPIENFIDLQTYKKDRSVTIIKRSEDNFLVLENGYTHDRFEVNISKLKKLLKILLKREFPRSNKVRLYSGEYSPRKNDQ